MARTTTPRPAARTTPGTTWKAAAAIGAGVLVLSAGAATFAEWHDEESVATDTTITSCVLDLAAGQPGEWTNIAGTDVTAAVTDCSYLIGPGDALTYRETLTIDAQGDLLQGTVSHNLRDMAGDAELLGQLNATAAMTLNGEPVEGNSATVVANDEVQELDVAVTVAFAATTTDLIGQGQSVDLGGLDIALTQPPIASN